MNEDSLDINKIIEMITPRISSYLLNQRNEKLMNIIIEKRIMRAFSTVIFLKIELERNKALYFVVKIIKHNWINKKIVESENQAVVEYNILKELYPKFKSIPGCSVPEPIFVIPDIELYCMYFVNGNLLMNNFRYTRFFSSQKEFNLLKKNMYQCGLWLREFHHFTGPKLESAEKSFDSIMERAEHRLTLIESVRSNNIPIDFKNHAMRLFNEQINELQGSKIIISGRHGDFTPLNMISDYEGITVFDFLGYQKDPIAVDLFKILLFLENERLSISSSKKRVHEIKKSFLSGYSKLPNIPTQVSTICEGMQRVVSLWGHLSNKKNHFHHKIESKRIISENLKWFYNNERKSLLYESQE